MSVVDDGILATKNIPRPIALGLTSFLSPKHTDLTQSDNLGPETASNLEVETDQLRNPLQGLVASILKCKNCKRRSPTRNMIFYDIAVSLTQYHGQPDHDLTLDACLSNYVKRETIPGVECAGWVFIIYCIVMQSFVKLYLVLIAKFL